jgi:hypothetical protein
MRPGDSEEPPGESKRQAERAGQTLTRNKVNAAALSNVPVVRGHSPGGSTAFAEGGAGRAAEAVSVSKDADQKNALFPRP